MFQASFCFPIAVAASHAARSAAICLPCGHVACSRASVCAAVKRSRAKRWARILDTHTWPNILRRYLLATRADLPITEQDVATDDILSLTPDRLAVKSALLLGSGERWWSLPPELHVRLLALLCDDLLQGAALRAELTGRIDATTQLIVRACHLAPIVCSWRKNPML